jgi:hypothetical protein
VAAYQAFEKLTGQASFGLATAYSRMGQHAEAQAVMRALEDRAKRQWVDPLLIASAYDGLGDRDAAMRWLEHGFQQKDFLVRLFVPWETPLLRTVRSDPRFAALRQRVVTTIWR